MQNPHPHAPKPHSAARGVAGDALTEPDNPPLPALVANTHPLIIAPAEVTVTRLEELRIRNTADYVLLYDVSPSDLEPQRLFEHLRAHPRIAIFDHHGACAPLHEVPGHELCAAEVIVRDLPILARTMVAAQDVGAPLKILLVTHFRNTDPDAFISRVLLESFFDPVRRPFIWDTPAHRSLLVEAARFGDTTFFGGVDLDAPDTRALPPAQRLGLAVLELFNEGKAQFVCDRLQHAAVLNRNLLAAAAKIEPELTQAGRIMLAIRSVYRAISAQLEGTTQGEASDIPTRYLQEVLGPDYRSWDNIKEQIIASCPRDNTESHIAQVHRMLRKAVLESLFSSQIRGLFWGKAVGDIYGPPHPPLWNEAAVESLFSRMSEQIPELLSDESRAGALADYFLRDMQRVRAVAERNTAIHTAPGNFDKRISITSAPAPLDPNAGIPRRQREHLIYDWLREAAAALAVSESKTPHRIPPWLHVMDRGRGHLVVSARFARHNEERPAIDLSHPNVLAELRTLESEAAARVKEPPTPLIVKTNLWLPDGAPLHVPREKIIELLLRRYDEIVQPTNAALSAPTYPLVEAAPGEFIPFTGISAAVRG